MAITIVGTPQTGFGNSGADATVDLSGLSLTENDVVIASSGSPKFTGNAPGIVTSGYTEIDTHTGTAGSRPTIGVWYKVMSATPDDDVVVSGDTSTATDTTGVAIALRGVDTSTVEDQTNTTAGETISTNPNPASITTQTDNAWVLPFAVSANNNDTTPGTISGYSNHISIVGNDTLDHTHAAATFEVTTAAAEDPGAWSSWSSGSWYVITVAIKPDVAAGTVVKDVVGVGVVPFAR